MRPLTKHVSCLVGRDLEFMQLEFYKHKTQTLRRESRDHAAKTCALRTESKPRLGIGTGRRALRRLSAQPKMPSCLRCAAKSLPGRDPKGVSHRVCSPPLYQVR